MPKTGLAKLEQGEVVLPPFIASWLRQVLAKPISVKQNSLKQQAKMPSFQYGGLVKGIKRPEKVFTTGEVPTPLVTGPGGSFVSGSTPPGYGNLPWLMNPSRQYQARMGPTAMAQYGGYQQMATGIMPEELQFRLWSTAPPSGAYRGLTYRR